MSDVTRASTTHGAPAPKRRWYRSLYWRLALGFVVFLALMLAAQGALVLWMLDRTAGSMPARSPARLAVLVAADVGAALSHNPQLDLVAYVRDQYGGVVQPFAVLMRDGRVAANRDIIPGELQQAIDVESQRPDRFARGRRPPRAGVRGAPAPIGRGVRAAATREWQVAPIIVDGLPAGRVVVLANAPITWTLREFGPTLATVGVTALGAGALLIALFVFGPARRRLRAIETAAVRLGAGDLRARVPEEGGDEAAAVAHAFNRMADELAARAEALSASERARRQLLADVSHELSTPLTALRGYVETLRMDDLQLDAATRARYLGIIEDEAHRLERLVGDLLDLARLEGGGGELRREPVPVARLFDRVAARHGRDAEQRGGRIVTRIGQGAEFVIGDGDRLEQALQNLAANALRHTQPGTEVTLASRREGDRIHLEVRDNGRGIPDEHLPHVFDRFYKADGSRHAPGTGLGLSIVRAIVERHGGTITVRNDHGAVFDIALFADSR